MKREGEEERQKNLDYYQKNKQIEKFIREVHEMVAQEMEVSAEARLRCEQYQKMLEKIKICDEVMNSPKEGWKLQKVNEQSELAVKVQGTNLEIRYEGILNANIENLCVMIYQVDLFSEWVPFCSYSEDLKNLSPLEKLCFFKIKVPLLTEFFCFLHGIGIDRIEENGSILIFGEGVNEEEGIFKDNGVDKEEKNTKKLKVLDMKYFVCEITCKQGNEYQFRAYATLDTHMPLIPEWVLKLVVRKIGAFIIESVVKKSQVFEGTVWEKHKKEHEEDPFYEWLHKRMVFWRENSKGLQGKM